MTDEELTRLEGWLLEFRADGGMYNPAIRGVEWKPLGSLTVDCAALVAEIRRLKSVALTFEDEADRLGAKIRDAYAAGWREAMLEVGRFADRLATEPKGEP